MARKRRKTRKVKSMTGFKKGAVRFKKLKSMFSFKW